MSFNVLDIKTGNIVHTSNQENQIEAIKEAYKKLGYNVSTSSIKESRFGYYCNQDDYSKIPELWCKK